MPETLDPDLPETLHFVAVHGAFRGAWYWEPLAAELVRRGHSFHAIDLPGMGHPAPPRRPDITMGEWISAVLKAVLQDLVGDAVTDGPANGAAERVVLLGHSMGGVVVQGALAEMGAPTPRVEAVLLDSPVVGPGQSAVDVSSEVPPAQLPPRDTWIEPTPLASGGELNDDLVAWANDRLCATPFGPQIDPLPTNVDASLERCHLIFFADTPAAFPAPVSRRRCESKGVPFTVAPGGHDQPLADSAAVAGVVLNLLEASS